MNQRTGWIDAATRVCVAFVLLCGLAWHSAAESVEQPAPTIELGTPFTDGAILQRDMPAKVWGWTEMFAKVTVSFAGQTKEAVADADGKWTVQLDPLEASATPSVLKVRAAIDREGTVLETQVEDLLVGEVWVASGQSNMQWLASKCDVGRLLQAGIVERVEAGEEPAPIIRETKVTDVFSALHPIERATGEWIDDGAQMSAIAYAFAYELWKELGVPIGIVNCSFSSTQIEAWTPREGFVGSDQPYTQSIEAQLRLTDPNTPEHRAAWSGYFASLRQAIEDNQKRVANGQPAEAIDLPPPGNLSNNRAASWLYNARMNPMVPYAVRGVIWNQGYANQGGGIDYYANLHSLIRGWRIVWQRPNLPVYFHQFYTPGNKPVDNHPALGSTAEMRLGAWLARDIPNTGMASQIDIGGSIHYFRKALPGQRLALHALKNQYGKDVAVDGPMFKSYTVKGDKLIVSFDHAEGGLVVGQVDTDTKNEATVLTLPDGASDVSLFYLADENKVWHAAEMRIEGERVVLSAPGVASPRGVSYASGGVGFQPNVYNRALLPMTPFILYDNEIVLKRDWPHDPLKVAGVEPDPNAGGLAYAYRKFPILSTQFRDHAVLQHGQPVKVWGAAKRRYFPDAPGERVIHFSFGDVKQSIPLTDEMEEWSVTLPAMPPTDKPRTLKATLTIDGEVVHERVAENVVVGDLWYVAAPKMDMVIPEFDPTPGVVRVMKRQAKRDTNPTPSRFSVAVSTTPGNRFASYWESVEPDTLHGAIAHRIAAQAGGRPVGVIFMQTNPGKDDQDVPLKSWLPFEALADAPSLAEDYAKLGTQYPGSPTYDDNIERYIKDWQAYWSEYIPEMIARRAVPDGSAWGVIPKLAAADAKSEATQAYNVMVHSFTPTALKGVIFIYGEDMLAATEPAAFNEQRKVLQTSWAERFGGSFAMTTLVADAKPLAFWHRLDAMVRALAAHDNAKKP